jgi:hypothetical protein
MCSLWFCMHLDIRLTYSASNSNFLFLKLLFRALLGWIIISADLFKLKTAFWHASSVVAFAIIQVASHHLKQPPHPPKKKFVTDTDKCIFSDIITGNTFQVVLKQNWSDKKGHIFGSHTHQFSIYSNPSTCWGPIIIIILALFSVVILLSAHPYC